ncbi:hypothetical protein SCB49_12965 [unidentified eubacterium SCB49]|nr:hypothetical protein SCB49_12965 [unidentified eubacterium SCB49]
MKIKIITGILSLVLMSCGNNEKTKIENQEVKEAQEAQEVTPDFQNEGHELVYNMVQKVGDYSELMRKKDVIYTYTYQTPDGKKDVSVEKYMFDGELSCGAYTTHERTLPDLEGTIEQGYDGKNYWLRHNGNELEDEAQMKRVVFNRHTNFYWFAMMQKLMDDSVKYEYKGEKQIDDKAYEIVKVSFITEDNRPTDIYQLYINKETAMVDQFLFTVADFGKMETPFLMELDYENVDGLLLPTKRKYKASTWDAEVTDAPWIQVTWSDIKFDNNLSIKDFK